MELEQIINAIRDHYLAAYRKAIASYRERFNPSAPEVLLEIGGNSPLVYRYYRMDLTGDRADAPNLTEVNPDKHLEFEKVHMIRNGLSLTLSPLVWNGVEFKVKPVLADDVAIRSWGTRWIDADEKAEEDADGLGAYLHSITVPKSNPDATEFSVDFGSAPTSCLTELLAVLADSGAMEVEIHSRTVLGQ